MFGSHRCIHVFCNSLEQDMVDEKQEKIDTDELAEQDDSRQDQTATEFVDPNTGKKVILPPGQPT